MKVQLLSDLHLEFFRDQGTEFIKSLDPSGVDVLILAGDISVGGRIRSALRQFCEKYPRVIYVSGNHEYYRCSPEEVAEYIEEAKAASPNLHVLDSSMVEIGGVRFAGATLWFRDDPMNFTYQNMLNDFHMIEDFVPWVYDENRKAEAFLGDVLSALEGPPDVVVTHHLPSNECVTPQYQGSPLNRFFVAPVADITPVDLLPRYWFFGHTHDPNSFTREGCRFQCNPMGYPHEPKRGFQKKLVFEIQPRSALP